MNEIINQAITWDELGNVERDKLEYKLSEATLYKEDMTLSVPISSNFIIPFWDVKKIEAVIINKTGIIKKVDFKMSYDNLVQPEADIIRLYVPYMIDELKDSYATITNMIVDKTVTFDPETNTTKISALGEVACGQLNDKVGPLFEKMIMEKFQIHGKVKFENNATLFDEKAKAFKECEEEDIEASMKEYMVEMQQRAAEKPAKPKEEKFSPGGGKGDGAKWGRQRREKELPAKGNQIMGKPIFGGATVELRDIDPNLGIVVVEGILFKKIGRKIKSGNYLVSLLITDSKTTVLTKAFVSENKWQEIDTMLKSGDQLKIKGEIQFDQFENMNSIMFSAIEKLPLQYSRQDTCQVGKRVELHAHTKMSAMDGLNEPQDIVKQSAFWGQPAVAITDHGVVQSFPDAAKAAKNQAKDGRNIKIIYGLEGYVFDDSDCIEEDGSINYKKKGTNHIILLAKTQEGLKNIYKLVSLSHLNYFYKKPRIPKSVLSKYREGIIVGSACEAGEVFQGVLNDMPEDELHRLADFYDYLEIQPLINNRFLMDKGIVADEEGLRELNRRIVKLGEELGKPVVATTDAHYDKPESAIYRNILMAGQGYKDAENGQGLFLRTTDEMLEEFSYLGEDTARKVVIDNTNLIADMIGEILPVPKGKYPPKIDGAEERLRKTCMEKAYSIYGNPLPELIEERLNKELNSIINNGYAVMYVSAQMLVQKSLEDGYLVGSRGSVGSSFAATMAGITEVNPLDPHYICPKCKRLIWGDMNLYDCGVDMPPMKCPDCGTQMNQDGFTIPFATFLGFDGDKEPDIDLNFAGEYQSTAHKYVGEIFGEKNVFKAGTVGTVAEKTAFGFVMKFCEERQLPVNKYEAERLAMGCTGVKRTTGQHPGGIIIVPDDHEIYEFCPVQHPANDTSSDIITTHFDYHKIDENLLKLDILGHNIPSMIRQLQDMTGVDPLTVSLTDKKVLSIFNGIEALDIKMPNYKFTHGSYAIPEFGTSFVRQMLDDTKPDKFADLVRISGFSHGTDVWLNNAQDYIRNGTATMREVISTRDDIMNYLILKGLENKTSFKIMEDVRKNRPLSEEQLSVMKEHGVPDWYIDSCIKIQYMFPRAHAVAYVMMSFRMAWYKVYYPAEFYATYFTSAVASFDADTILSGVSAIVERMEAINAKGTNATQKEKDDYLVLEVAYELYGRGFEFAPAELGLSDPMKFSLKNGKILLPMVAVEGVGETAARAICSEYAVAPFGTIEEAINRAKLNKTAVEGLRRHGVFEDLPETDQLSMF